MANSILGHFLARKEGVGDKGQAATYIHAANGIFLYKKRPEMEIIAPLYEFDEPLPGLTNCAPCFVPNFEQVPRAIFDRMYAEILAAAAQDKEILFHLSYEDGQWELMTPQQIQTTIHCEPLDKGPESSHARALIEVHSHHRFPAVFSETDDKDETAFRLYAVIGNVHRQPEIAMRTHIQGEFPYLSPDTAFDLPTHFVRLCR